MRRITVPVLAIKQDALLRQIEALDALSKPALPHVALNENRQPLLIELSVLIQAYSHLPSQEIHGPHSIPQEQKGILLSDEPTELLLWPN